MTLPKSEQGKELASSAKDLVGDAVDNAKPHLGAAVGQAKDVLDDLTHQAKDQGVTLGHRAKAAAMPKLAEAATAAAEKTAEMSEHAGEQASQAKERIRPKRSRKGKVLTLLGLAALAVATGLVARKLTARADRGAPLDAPDHDHTEPPADADASDQPREPAP